MKHLKQDLFAAFVICTACFTFAVVFSRLIGTTAVDSPWTEQWKTIIIDPGHGGEDGGAIACDGTPESQINLQIAGRLDDFCHLLGYKTYMIRTDDRAIYDTGSDTLSAKKVSDLRNRVKIINDTPNGVLVSIHQNHFSEEKYHGAQVFFAETAGSQPLAEETQQALRLGLDETNSRSAKKADSVYLMKNIQCTGILIECGFLSNRKETQLLQTEDYQKKMTMVIGCSICNYLQKESEKNEI